MSISKFIVGMMVVALVACTTTNKVDDKKKAEAHFKLGVSHLNSGDIQPAYLEFQTALKYDKKNKHVHNALGTVYLQLEDFPKAVEHFQNAADIDPMYSDAYNNVCYTYYLMRKWDDAITYCKSALSNPLYITPEKAFYNLGRTYYRKGQYDDAIVAYGEALKRMPTLHLAYYGLALSYNGKREYGKSAEEMSKAILLDPEFKGDRDKAEQVFSNKKADKDEAQDIRDYLEILKY